MFTMIVFASLFCVCSTVRSVDVMMDCYVQEQIIDCTEFVGGEVFTGTVREDVSMIRFLCISDIHQLDKIEFTFEGVSLIISNSRISCEEMTMVKDVTLNGEKCQMTPSWMETMGEIRDRTETEMKVEITTTTTSVTTNLSIAEGIVYLICMLMISLLTYIPIYAGYRHLLFDFINYSFFFFTGFQLHQVNLHPKFKLVINFIVKFFVSFFKKYFVKSKTLRRSNRNRRQPDRLAYY